IEFTVIPGAAAFVNALVLSGKPAHDFYFAGFLPNRTIARQNQLKKLAQLKITIIFYESCHRIVACLEDVLAVFGDKEICVARELTKKFEEIKRSKVSEIITHFQQSKPRGEFVVIV
ncbi:MAG: 16S rRNA (cytidine(1402)-2'-O)-methyltransferase, partial [Candidatus Omnitrophica bacterium]|nr:16S rRNA (cytidine(1402)-2'-O)-methyltransferase [Candidatus Omnitrophota bacterium]